MDRQRALQDGQCVSKGPRVGKQVIARNSYKDAGISGRMCQVWRSIMNSVTAGQAG